MEPRYVATKDGYRDYRVWDRLHNMKCGAHHRTRREAELEAKAMNTSQTVHVESVK